MNDEIRERCLEIAAYVLENQATVRQAAARFGVSKSSVHKDLTERLETINASLAGQVRKILDINKAERHIRGGMATRLKYQHEHQIERSTQPAKIW